MDVSQIIIGLVAGPLVGWAAWRAGLLSRSGAAAAGLVGAAIYAGGGLLWAAGLLLFFLSSSLLSRAFPDAKRTAEEKYAKGAQRDGAQVLANGGLAALLAIVHLALPRAAWPWIGFLGALAAVNADTWATELGVLSKHVPRMITTGKTVEPGTSGGVTLAGVAASAGGAGLIGALALLTAPPAAWAWFAAAAGGVAGSLLDSLLGATAQAIYYCPLHEKETEQHPQHTCGTATHLVRGLRWLGNDLVNFAASLMGAGAAIFISRLPL